MRFATTDNNIMMMVMVDVVVVLVLIACGTTTVSLSPGGVAGQGEPLAARRRCRRSVRSFSKPSRTASGGGAKVEVQTEVEVLPCSAW